MDIRNGLKKLPMWPRQSVVLALVLLALLFLLSFLLMPGEDSPGSPSGVLPVEVVPAPEYDENGWDAQQTLRLLNSDGRVETLTMREYLWRVVAAEMPASFQIEALKAQAVAARTYCVRRRASAGEKHPNADVCGDYTCCQAYLTREQAAESWGADADRYSDKVAWAVAETDGLLCLYDGEPIDAVFFSSAAGKTQGAIEVWGTSVPYLQAVSSPEGEEVPGWKTMVTFTADEVKSLVMKTWPTADLSGKVSTWFSRPELNASGAVSKLKVGGVTVTGVQARTAFGLRSTHFSVETDGNDVIFWVTGYGHGVGMSQYGANAMAKEGKTFRDILQWYYTGVTVSEWEG